MADFVIADAVLLLVLEIFPLTFDAVKWHNLIFW